MITRDDLCRIVIHNYCYDRNIDEKAPFKDPNRYALINSNIGKALSYLIPNEMTDDIKNHVKEQNGYIFVSPSTNRLSFDELFNLLPETISNGFKPNPEFYKDNNY